MLGSRKNSMRSTKRLLRIRRGHHHAGHLAEVPLLHLTHQTTETPHRILDLQGNSNAWGPRHIHRRTPLLGHTTLKYTGPRHSRRWTLRGSGLASPSGVTWYHRAAPLTSPSSHRHRNLSYTTCTDTKLSETQLTTLAFSLPGRIGTST
jgi:hypothetical protein